MSCTEDSFADSALTRALRPSEDSLAARCARAAAAQAVSGDPLALTRFGRYSILKVLGRGGQGVVYEAYDPGLDRVVALKVGRARRRPHELAREGRLLAQLRHKNLVAVYALEIIDGRLALAMEKVDGMPLHRWACEGKRGVAEIGAVVAQIADGLAAMHAAGLQHRDVKPKNIVIQPDHNARLIDFGLARALASEARSAGTPAFVAPEQRNGATPHPAADQYALARTLEAALAASAHTGPWPRWLRRVIARATAQDPSARFASTQSFAAALRSGLRQRRRRRSAASVVVLALAGAGAWQGASLRRELQCQRLGDALRPVWHDRLRADVEASLTGTSPVSQDAARRTIESLDRWESGWRAAVTRVCEAPQTPSARAEATCHQGLRLRFEATARALRGLEPRTSHAGLALARQLPLPDTCSDATRPPSAPDYVAPRLLAARRDLQAFGELCGAGALRDCGRRFDEVAASLTEFDECTWKPRVDLERARWSQAKDDTEAAAELAAAAAWAAEACGLSDVELEAKIFAARLHAITVRDHELGRVWLDAAASALVRAQEPKWAQLELQTTRGQVAIARGDFKEAAEILEEAVAAYGATMHARGGVVTLEALATALGGAGDYDNAQRWANRALQEVESELGRDHPRVAFALSTLASVTYPQSLPRAVEHARRAVTILEAWPGQHGRHHATLHLQLSAFAAWAADHETAIASAEEGARLARASVPASHPLLGEALNMLATALARSGRFAEALEPSQQSHALLTERLGHDHIATVLSAVTLGDLHRATDDPSKAQALACPAAERLVSGRVQGPVEAKFNTAVSCAMAMLDQGRPQPARALLRRLTVEGECRAPQPQCELWAQAEAEIVRLGDSAGATDDR